MSKIVEVVANNLFHGSSLKQLKAGTVVEIDDATAEQWMKSGKAKASKEKKADQIFEVASPAQSEKKADTSGLEKQVADLTSQVEKSEQEKSDLQTRLDAETVRADNAEKSLAELQAKK